MFHGKGCFLRKLFCINRMQSVNASNQAVLEDD